MTLTRASGIILHPTSLPGPDGIGDLGPEAFRWIDFLHQSKCQLWQILPLGPTGYGDSPYQCFSAFAGNPYLISPTLLMEQGLLRSGDLTDRPVFPQNCVDFGAAINWKNTLLDRAFNHFRKSKKQSLHQEFQDFCENENHWLTDFALFMGIKECLGGVSWDQWTAGLRSHDAVSLAEFESKNQLSVERQKFRQFIFFHQWSTLKNYAHTKGIQVIGDIPIFVSYDSADAWAHPELFHFDSNGKPSCVAGVPPDYFSPTGQLWGNPIYRWDVHKRLGFDWWIERVKAVLEFVDIIRIDHFRGFASYWQIPFGMPTAEKGRWVKGPGQAIFKAIRSAVPNVSILAEDLGEITPDVIELRDSLDLPGMKVLQFAFASDEKDPFLPHNFSRNCVAYTGTHDNDTTLGWYQSASEKEKDYCRRYLGRSGEDICWDFIRLAWGSVADYALAPMQDFLNLDSSARMNYPGKPSGNWNWRLSPGSITQELILRLQEFNKLYDR
jgi:4-alpha-glucanotransferase